MTYKDTAEKLAQYRREIAGLRARHGTFTGIRHC
jgi:hypothetical protein